MHQALQGATFHIEHIVPESRGGSSELENLAFCCPSCNLHKSDRIEAQDPASGSVIRLFNPRLDSWEEHFQWDSYELRGRTPMGRATILALELNHPRRLLIRRAEERFSMFPSNE
jgi:hypothetical protein